MELILIIGAVLGGIAIVGHKKAIEELADRVEKLEEKMGIEK